MEPNWRNRNDEYEKRKLNSSEVGENAPAQKKMILQVVDYSNVKLTKMATQKEFEYELLSMILEDMQPRDL